MKIYEIFKIIFLGFIFVFIIQTFWGRLEKKFGAFGGFLAGTFISGSIWMLAHGIKTPFINNAPNIIWIDMAWAPAIAGIAMSLYNKYSISKSIPKIFIAIIAGVFCGFILNIGHFF